MTVTKEAITAAALRLRDETGGFGNEDDRAVAEQMLEAALPFLSSRSAEAGKPVVKGLEWFEDASVNTALGFTYRVYEEYGMDTIQWAVNVVDGRFPSKDAAKAAAQTDYEARILSALEVEP